MSHARFQYTAFIALGSNLGDRFGHLVSAVRALNANPSVRVVAASGVYETAPVGPVAQGAYLNACLQVQTDLCATDLLHFGLQIEAQNGRVRTQRFGPRTLDIDLLAHSGTDSIETPELILPHPRLHERAFVLVPLADIAPQLVVGAQSVAQWLQKCPQSDLDDVRSTAFRLPLAQGDSPASAPRLHRVALPSALSPQTVFRHLRECHGCVWLDSARSNPQGDARYSLVAANPISRLRFIEGRLERIDYVTAGEELCKTLSDFPEVSNNLRNTKGDSPKAKETLTLLPPDDPLHSLEQWLAAFGRSATNKTFFDGGATSETFFSEGETSETFFSGGAIGYFSYEFGRQWEHHQPLPAATAHFPQMDWALYDCAFVYDELSKMGHIVACSQTSHKAALAKAEALAAFLQRAADIPKEEDKSPPTVETAPRGKMAPAAQTEAENDNTRDSQRRRKSYVRAVEKVRDYIAQGDIYQVNIAQHFKAPLHESPADLYLRLRALNPAPYAAYLDTGAFQILSSSPELFLCKRGASVHTRPIKGTRPRGKNTTEDARLCKELLGSEKERAELLMIVDLERNDLGRVCEPGSVQVQSLYRVESYATVHHLVADVCGTLQAQTGLADLLRATFPGGSITGAPKVRAMEIIDELEQRQRGIFCGAIGLIGLDGSVDLNIAIRTLLCTNEAGNRQVHVSVGAGLVWDSNPEQEYEETLHKAEALLKAIHQQGNFRS